MLKSISQGKRLPLATHLSASAGIRGRNDEMGVRGGKSSLNAQVRCALRVEVLSH
jgi:hypothetical protein